MPRAIKAANSGTSTSRWSSIITKRRTTQYMHRPPVLMSEVSEVVLDGE